MFEYYKKVGMIRGKELDINIECMCQSQWLLLQLFLFDCNELFKLGLELMYLVHLLGVVLV